MKYTKNRDIRQKTQTVQKSQNSRKNYELREKNRVTANFESAIFLGLQQWVYQVERIRMTYLNRRYCNLK